MHKCTNTRGAGQRASILAGTYQAQFPMLSAQLHTDFSRRRWQELYLLSDPSVVTLTFRGWPSSMFLCLKCAHGFCCIFLEIFVQCGASTIDTAGPLMCLSIQSPTESEDRLDYRWTRSENRDMRHNWISLDRIKSSRPLLPRDV